MRELTDPVVLAWWSWMGPMLWQSSLLVAVVAGLDAVLRRWTWPQVRYALWFLVLVKLLLPPAWYLPSGIVPRLQPLLEPGLVAVLPGLLDAHGETGPETRQGVPSAQEPAVAVDGFASSALDPGALTRRSAPTWLGALFAVWVLGVVGFAAVLVVRITALRRWHREQEERGTIPPWFGELMVATARRLGLDRLPSVVFSDRAVTPAVYGVLRPTLLLPSRSFETLSRVDAEHVLLHELAHLKRGDLWVNALGLLVAVVYWFNPLVALSQRRLRHVREMCCDLTIANLLRERTVAYRQTLLETARRLLTETLEPGMGLLGVFEEPFRLVPRLRWLERPTWKHRALASATSVGVLALLTPLLLPMAAAQPQAGGPTRVAEAEGGELVYVRDLTRVERRLLGFKVHSKTLSVAETWVGDRVIANTENGRTLVVDTGRHLMRLVDHRQRTFVEAPLPLQPETLFEPELAERHRLARTAGEVRRAGNMRTVLGRRCVGYEVKMWRPLAGPDRPPRTVNVWATRDVPVDLTLYRTFLEVLRQVYSRDDDLRRELDKVDGFQALLETSDGRSPLATWFVTQTEEISRRHPPAGVFDPPPGYRRTDRVSSLDL